MLHCEDCGKYFPNTFPSCPFCYVAQEFHIELPLFGHATCSTCHTVHEAECPNCDKPFKKGETYCTNCGRIRKTGVQKGEY